MIAESVVNRFACAQGDHPPSRLEGPYSSFENRDEKLVRVTYWICLLCGGGKEIVRT